MARFVVESNNQWLVGVTDGTVKAYEGIVQPDLNTHDVPNNVVSTWKQAGRVGSNRHSTHRELEVFGVVFNGAKLEALRKDLIDHQVLVNREGCMVMYFNVGAGDKYIRQGRSQMRRLYDLFDWSKHGVQVPTPVETQWDGRLQLATGKLMVGGQGGQAELKKELEEKQKENEKLQAEKDKEIEELKKQQAKDKEDQLAAQKENEKLQADKDKEIEELKKQAKEKDDEIAAKNKQIGNLRNALASFT